MFDHVLCGTCCCLGSQFVLATKKGAGNRVHTCVRSSNFTSKRTDSGASPKMFRSGVVGVQGEALAMAQIPFRLAWKRRAFSRADKLDEKAVEPYSRSGCITDT